MKQYLTFLFLVVICITSFSQSDLRAKIEYENAEQAFAKGEFETAVLSLIEVETILQKWTPNVSYLKIQALNEVADLTIVEDKYTVMLISEVEQYLEFSASNENLIVFEKYKIVDEISRKVIPLKKIAQWDKMSELINGNEAYNKKEYNVALEWYKKASDLGNAVADYRIAYMYLLGYIGDRNSEIALKWFTQSSKRGYAKAEWQIGLMYYNGDGIATNYKESLSWLKSGALHGYGECLALLGSIHLEGKAVNKSYQEAMSWWLKGADMGNVTSMENIGYLYKNGNGVDVSNVEAAKWFLKACDKKSSTACVQLAALYHYNNNPGIVQNFSEAMKYYLKAGEHKQAYLELGWMYEKGQSVASDVKLAVTYYEKAYELGNDWALFRLGTCMKDIDFTDEKPEGQRTEDFAIIYFTEAAKKGIKEAVEQLIDIYSNGFKGIKRDAKMKKYWMTELAKI